MVSRRKVFMKIWNTFVAFIFECFIQLTDHSLSLWELNLSVFQFFEQWIWALKVEVICAGNERRWKGQFFAVFRNTSFSSVRYIALFAFIFLPFHCYQDSIYSEQDFRSMWIFIEDWASLFNRLFFLQKAFVQSTCKK